MIAADFQAFTEIFQRLARQQGGPNDAQSIADYFEALKNLSLEAVDAAAVTLGQTGDWFPKSGKWHDAAQSIQRAHVGSHGMIAYLLRCASCGARTDHPVGLGTFQEQLDTLRDVWARRCDECGGKLRFEAPNISEQWTAKWQEGA